MNKTHKVIAVGIASAATLIVFALPQERVPAGGAVPAPQHAVVMTSPETQPDAVFDMTFTSQRERMEGLPASAR